MSNSPSPWHSDQGPVPWKLIATGSVCVVATALLQWIAFGTDKVTHAEFEPVRTQAQNAVSHAEILSIIQTEAPFNHDKERIWGVLSGIDKHDAETNQHFRDLDQLTSRDSARYEAIMQTLADIKSEIQRLQEKNMDREKGTETPLMPHAYDRWAVIVGDE